MSVYVDSAHLPFGRMIMCHMIADSIEELHSMADKIGIQRKWFQNKGLHPHYDISKGKRALALLNGVIFLETKEFRIKLREIRTGDLCQ